ncbi:MAG: tetratricopeptide repeat protein [Phaeodactylibacter sp.]|nr:tetratricopeptide repeat protein [Phaeodactylibacter sp.]MCB9296283.1 tetratricopeptide repeat protein [Lewinellaceae bacterium]
MKRILSTLTLAVIGLASAASAQPQAGKADSLENLLMLANTDQEKANLLDDLAWEYLYTDPLRARVYADSSQQLFTKIEDEAGRGKALVTLANTFVVVQKYDTAASLYRKALEILEPIEEWQKAGAAYNNLGIISGELGNYEEAKNYYIRGLEFRKRAKDSTSVAQSLLNLGTVYHHTGGEQELAIAYWTEAAELARQLDLPDLEGAAVNNIGWLYMEKKEAKLSQSYFMKAVQIFKESNNQFRLSGAYNNIGSSYIELHHIDSAVFFFKKSLEGNDFNDLAKSYSLHGLGNAYYLRGENELALKYYKEALNLENELGVKNEITNSLLSIGNILTELGRLGEAHPYLVRARVLADSTGDLWHQSQAAKFLLLSELRSNGQLEKAAMVEKMAETRDSLFSREKFRAIAEIEAQYQVKQEKAEKKALQVEAALQESRVQRQKFAIIGISAGMLFVLGFLFLLYRQYTLRVKQNLQLAAKNAQIHLLNRELSHRVKNNLQFVSSLLEMQGRRAGSEDARAALQESENRLQAMALLHRRLYQQEEGATTVELGSYLEELCGYLESTYPADGPPPEIHTEIEPIQADAEQAGRLGLIVNELLTNSFKHAFHEVEQPEVFLGLRRTEDGYIRLSYRDNGKGMPVGYDVQNSRSLGLKLIHTLSRQLSGSVEVSSQPGARYEFEFRGMKKTG